MKEIPEEGVTPETEDVAQDPSMPIIEQPQDPTADAEPAMEEPTEEEVEVLASMSPEALEALNEKDAKKEQGPEPVEEMTPQEAKRNNVLYIVIAAIFVVIGIAAVMFNSGMFSSDTTDSTSTAVIDDPNADVLAVTINGTDYSVAELNYHVVNTYQSFVGSYSDYLSYFGLDTTISLKEQVSMDGVSTWYDYFVQQGISQMGTIVTLLENAETAGYVFDDAVEQSKLATLAELETYAPYYGYTDAEEYLQLIYGTTMTMELYESLLLQSLQAEAYSYAVVNGFTYDDATLEATYALSPNSYDMVECEYLYIYNPVATVDADGNAIEVTEEMTAAALEESATLVEQMYQDYSAGASLADVATSSDLAVYQSPTATAYSESTVPDWLFDESRQTGDSEILVDDDYGVYYIVVFHDRYREDYNLIDVRHILAMPATGTLYSGEEGYEEEVAALDAAALEKAQAIYDEFLAGDQSEDSFATLANAYSEDTGSSTNGGLYELVAKGEMVETFEDWCFDESRQVGDTGIVATDYGYHVMYFSGYELPYWQSLVSASLIETDYTAWYEQVQASITTETHEDGLALVGSTL